MIYKQRMTAERGRALLDELEAAGAVVDREAFTFRYSPGARDAVESILKEHGLTAGWAGSGKTNPAEVRG